MTWFPSQAWGPWTERKEFHPAPAAQIVRPHPPFRSFSPSIPGSWQPQGRGLLSYPPLLILHITEFSGRFLPEVLPDYPRPVQDGLCVPSQNCLQSVSPVCVATWRRGTCSAVSGQQQAKGGAHAQSNTAGLHCRCFLSGLGPEYLCLPRSLSWLPVSLHG